MKEGIRIVEYLSADEKLVIALPSGRELYVPALLSQLGDEDELKHLIKEAVERWREFEILKNKAVMV